MSESDDAKQLAALLDRQAYLAERLAQPLMAEERQRIEDELRDVRKQCIELVDRYFRQVLHPILISRFPGKVTGPQSKLNVSAPVNVVAQFTQLLNDFFVQVLSDPSFNHPFWRKRTLIELRNYASIVISNRGLRDALRRRRKQEAIGDQAVRQAYEDQLAAEIDSRFVGTALPPADALEVIEKWDNGGDPKQRKYARLLRLLYIAGMSMEQAAKDMDLDLKTAYRNHQKALLAVRSELASKN